MQNLITFLLTFVLFISCSKGPLTGRKLFTPIPHAQMVTLGKSNDTQVLQESRVSDNTEYKQMVQEAGRRISKAVATEI